MKISPARFLLLLAVVGAGCWHCPAVSAEAPADTQAQIRELRELVRLQGERIAALEALVAKQQQTVETMVAAQPAAPAPKAGPVEAVVALAKGTDQLKITGDFRLRYQSESREEDGIESDRDRFLPRLRLGLVWKSSEWDVGVGLATGGEKGTSTNDTWNDNSVFKTDDIRLDYAYAQRRWQDFTVTVGQQKNPYLGTWAIWDSDVRPTGATGQYSHGPWFATVGAYHVRHYGRDEDNAYLGALQIGAQGTRGKLSGKAALTWYHYNRATVDANDTTTQPVQAIDSDEYRFSLASLYAEATYKADAWKGKVFGEFTRNFAADGAVSQVTDMPAGSSPDGDDTAWVLGASVNIKAFDFGYSYAHIEADSVYGQVNDATIGSAFGSTDIEGHILTVGYAVTQRLRLAAQAYFAEPIERTDQEDGQLFLLDAVWRF